MLGEPALLDGVPMNAQLVEDVTMYEELGIPAGCTCSTGPCSQATLVFARFEWDEERLPNAETMIDSLRSRGYRLAMWSGMWACGDGENDLGTEANALGYIAPSPDPSAPPNCETSAAATSSSM